MTIAIGRLALGTAVILTGCVNTAFTPTTGLYLPPRPPDCYLDVIYAGTPPFAYVVIGQISTDSMAPGLAAVGESNEVAVQRMKTRACEAGAHGLLQVAASSQGSWGNNGYSKSTSGGAVAFIYVDSNGHALPPPTGPHLVIQPGASASPTPGGSAGTAPAQATPVVAAAQPVQASLAPQSSPQVVAAPPPPRAFTPSSTEPATLNGYGH